MWHRRVLISVLSILWSICRSELTLFDVGFTSYVTNLGDRGPSNVYLFYPRKTDGKYHTTTEVDLEYLFDEISTTGYDLKLEAVLNSPVKQGKYPIVAYLHGEGGFSLDTHTLLTQISAMGFVVVTADMPEYRVGDPVLASAVQSFMGQVLTSLSHSCPSGTKEICDAIDFKNIVVLGPGVVDTTCTLSSWTKLGLHPSAQLVLDGEVEVDFDCHPVEFDTQDVSFLAIGNHELNSIFNERVETLRDRTQEDTEMSAYLLGFPQVPYLAAFTNLCEIAHQIRPIRHLAGTKSCSDIDKNDLNDAQTMTRVIISNILVHHFRNSPMTSPVNNFDPKDYSYLYRAIGEGRIKDAVGKLNEDSSGVNILPNSSESAYSFRNTTALAVLPLIMVGVLYFTCGIGLCMSDCRNVKGICFDGLISQSFRDVFSRRHSTQLSRNSSSQMGEYLRRLRSQSATPDTQFEHSTSSPKTVITYSTFDFLTGDQRSPTPKETPRSTFGSSRRSSIELITLDQGNIRNSHKEPLIPSCEPRITKTVKKMKDGLPRSKPSIKKQKRNQKISNQELYEALGSGTDSDGEETKPITNSELNKLLKV